MKHITKKQLKYLLSFAHKIDGINICLFKKKYDNKIKIHFIFSKKIEKSVVKRNKIKRKLKVLLKEALKDIYNFGIICVIKQKKLDEKIIYNKVSFLSQTKTNFILI